MDFMIVYSILRKGWNRTKSALEKGVARRLPLQRLSGRLSPCGWGPGVAWWWVVLRIHHRVSF